MIYEKVKRMCDENNVTICKLERTLGIGNGTIRCWKTKSPRVDLLKKVCDYFGITLDEMVKAD